MANEADSIASMTALDVMQLTDPFVNCCLRMRQCCSASLSAKSDYRERGDKDFVPYIDCGRNSRSPRIFLHGDVLTELRARSMFHHRRFLA